ncbi:MAG: hypothetical protein MAG451_01671 [Anaerolineales bacterium]|nr:hypothetical protein [Anaerolineales bacterium]
MKRNLEDQAMAAAAMVKVYRKFVGKGNVFKSQVLRPAPTVPMPAPRNIIVPKNRPRRSTGTQRAMRSCQAVAIVPAPKTCHAYPTKKSPSPHAGDRAAMGAASTITHIGARSRKSPRLTTTGFLRASRSTTLAVKSWGRNQPACAITAASPMGSGLDVSLLMKSGTIVLEDTKLRPNQKVALSSRLTVKFQR